MRDRVNNKTVTVETKTARSNGRLKFKIFKNGIPLT